jgi:hypothetical protein
MKRRREKHANPVMIEKSQKGRVSFVGTKERLS